MYPSKPGLLIGFHGCDQAVRDQRVSLIYRYKPLKKEIDLLLIWNTYQNPKKLRSIK